MGNDCPHCDLALRQKESEIVVDNPEETRLDLIRTSTNQINEITQSHLIMNQSQVQFMQDDDEKDLRLTDITATRPNIKQKDAPLIYKDRESLDLLATVKKGGGIKRRQSSRQLKHTDSVIFNQSEDQDIPHILPLQSNFRSIHPKGQKEMFLLTSNFNSYEFQKIDRARTRKDKSEQVFDKPPKRNTMRKY